MSRIVIDMKCFSGTRLLEQARTVLRVMRTLSAFLFSLLLTNGCTSMIGDINPPEHLNEREPKVQQMADAQSTVRGDKDPPVVTLQLGRTLRPMNLRPSDDLPATVKIGATNLNNVPVTTALQAVLADTDITLLWESEELQDRKVTLMNLKGSLPVVVERICRAAKVLCAYRNGALELSEEDTFVVELPAVATSASATGATDTIASSIESLIDGKVKADTAGGNLIYTTNAEGHERVQGYLEQLRNGRPLIVMQLYIWQVTLDSTKKMGINWKDLKLPDVGGKDFNFVTAGNDSNFSGVGTTEGVSLGAVMSGAIDVNLLAGFLGTQGKVQNISSPQLTFVSGSSAKFEVGDSERYVSQVGTLVNSTVSGTGTTSGASNNTVSTEELKTGLQISITGSYEGGVVFSTLQLKTSDFIKFTPVPTGSTQLQLPKTANRTVETVLRVRPGDNLVLAGLQTTREDRNKDGLPVTDSMGGLIPMFGSNVISTSELVLMVKPSVVFFSDKNAPDLSTAEAHRTPVDSKAVAGGDRIVVDEPKTAAPEDKKEVSNPASVAAVPVPVAPAKPNELQSEFGTVVKLYEDTNIPPVKTPLTASPPPVPMKASAPVPVKEEPQNILPAGETP